MIVIEGTERSSILTGVRDESHGPGIIYNANVGGRET